ncbi:MAG TPA: hypothetical protein VK461_07555 [Acidimicrobiales bacterium]|nr:hypothetical protein [Acidimicrobiales bacterium]
MKRLGLVVVALLGLTACGKQTVATGGGTSVTYSTSPSSLVVRVDTTGGFVPVETVFTNLPIVSIYGDGSVITSGPVPMIYPGPVVPNLLVRKLDTQGMQAVLTAAQDAGILTDPIDYGQPPVADVPDTVVTVNANEKSYTQSANALGGDFGTDNLTPAQIEARDELSKFVDSMTDLETLVGAEHIGPEQPYTITGWRLRATAVDQLPTGEPAPTVVPWPIASLPLASIGDCTAVTDAATAKQVTDTMSKANQLTYFTDAGRTYQVLVRPLLPDEASC